MRRFKILLFLVICSLNIYSQCTLPEIISPNGGEEFFSGEEFEIEFHYGPIDWFFSDNLFFYYSLDSGENWIFVDTIGIDSNEVVLDPIINFTWLVPENTSENCIIKVSRFEQSCWDESDNVFTISEKSSSVINTENGERSTIFYPNPVVSGQNLYAKFDNKYKEEITVRLFNQVGLQIDEYKTKENELTINTSGLQKGLYFLISTQDNKLTKSKIIIR